MIAQALLWCVGIITLQMDLTSSFPDVSSSDSISFLHKQEIEWPLSLLANRKLIF